LKKWVSWPVVRHAAALALFTASFCALLLPKLLPARSGQILSNSPADGAILLWSLGWWPHAVAHGILVPYTHAVFAPDGTNLAWTTSVPTAGFLMAPVTRAFGVFAAFNALALLAPVSAAWTMYLLVHRVTRRWWPSLAAGLLFALSPLETSEVAIGHLNLSLTALVPMAAYLVVRHLEGSIRPAVLVPLLGVVLAAEIGVSTEVFATTTLFGGLALLLLYAFDRPRRGALRSTAKVVGAGYVAAGVLASPLLYAALVLRRPPGLASAGHAPAPFSGVETHVSPHLGTLRAGLLHPSGPGSWVATVVLALPLFAILAHLAWTKRRGPVLRALAATAGVALLCSVGVLVVGHTTVPTPWALARHLPFLGLIRPQRLSLFVWLIAAAGAGVWLAARERSPWSWGAGALAIAALLPAMWWGAWTSVVPAPAWAADPPFRPGENVAVVAGPGPRARQLEDLAFPTVWQAESGFTFRLANAYVGSFPPPLPLAVRQFEFARPLGPAQARDVLAWLHQAGVRSVVVMRPANAVVGSVHRLLGTDPVPVGTVVLFRVPG